MYGGKMAREFPKRDMVLLFMEYNTKKHIDYEIQYRGKNGGKNDLVSMAYILCRYLYTGLCSEISCIVHPSNDILIFKNFPMAPYRKNANGIKNWMQKKKYLFSAMCNEQSDFLANFSRTNYYDETTGKWIYDLYKSYEIIDLYTFYNDLKQVLYIMTNGNKNPVEISIDKSECGDIKKVREGMVQGITNEIFYSHMNKRLI